VTPEEQLNRWLKEIDQQIAQGRLDLSRDQFNQIELPTSYGNLTGMLPGSYPGYPGLPTADFLSGSLGAFGYVGNDPRYAAMGYGAGTQTIPFRNLVLKGQEIQGGWQQQASDRALRQADLDAKMELETGVPYAGGAPLPTWLRPYSGWVKEYMQRNGGLVPNGPDFNAALGQGQVKTDDGGRVNQDGTVSYYSQQAGWQVGGQIDRASNAVVHNAVGQQLAAGGRAGAGGVGAEGMVRPGAPGSATAGAYGTGAPRSQAQRDLEERGRATDLTHQIQVTQNEIDRLRADSEIADRSGRLDIARSLEARANELERRNQDLNEQKAQADIALRAADLVNVRGAGDVFQSIARARGLEGTNVPGTYNAFQRGGGIPGLGGFESFTMRRPGSAVAAAGAPGVLPSTGAPATTMQRPGQQPSPEDFLNPRAGTVSGSMGLTLARPDRIRARDWERATPTERGVASSAYQENDITPQDLESLIASGAPRFQRANRARFVG
jgi:hypothetical protein